MSDVRSFLVEKASLNEEQFPWGTLTWLCSDRLSPGAAQTVGVCHILPRARNPRHYHPNCEEVLHVVRGSGLHSFGDEMLQLGPGDTLRIPAGVIHNFENTGDEPLMCIITFSSGQRETVFL